MLQSSSVDVKHGDKYDSERTSETGRSLMDATELRQMVKYQQAVAIISNAPPVRLSYPPFAKQPFPPQSQREGNFLKAFRPEPPLMADAFTKPLTNEPQSNQTISDVQQQWVQAIHGMSAQQSPLRFESEYDPALIGEADFPLFDLAGLER